MQPVLMAKQSAQSSNGSPEQLQVMIILYIHNSLKKNQQENTDIVLNIQFDNRPIGSFIKSNNTNKLELLMRNSLCHTFYQAQSEDCEFKLHQSASEKVSFSKTKVAGYLDDKFGEFIIIHFSPQSKNYLNYRCSYYYYYNFRYYCSESRTRHRCPA